MADNSLYVYVLRTDALILGVFVEKMGREEHCTGLAHGEAEFGYFECDPQRDVSPGRGRPESRRRAPCGCDWRNRACDGPESGNGQRRQL